MQNLTRLSGCDLHLHILGAYYAEDVLELGKAVYQQGAWDEYHYADTYQALFDIQAGAGRYFIEPRPKGRPASKRSESCPGTQERFLDQILRILKRPQKTIPID